LTGEGKPFKLYEDAVVLQLLSNLHADAVLTKKYIRAFEEVRILFSEFFF
jgi:hypothetical protein